MYNCYEPFPCPYKPNMMGPNLNNMPMPNIPNPYHMCPCCYTSQYDNLEPYGQLPNSYMPYDNKPYYKVKPYTSRAHDLPELKDYGPDPFVINIEKASVANNNFRSALWTGEHLQVTLMSIKVGEDIGLELHSDTDQFLRIEQGEGIVRMGDSKDNLNYQQRITDDFAIVIPAGKWHNVINTGRVPLKLYSIYAPPHHPHGTVHQTKADAEAAEDKH